MWENDPLHSLIHRLDQAEKRYFKVFGGRHSRAKQGKSVRLFDAIAGQKEYDADRLRQQFEGEKFIVAVGWDGAQRNPSMGASRKHEWKRCTQFVGRD